MPEVGIISIHGSVKKAPEKLHRYFIENLWKCKMTNCNCGFDSGGLRAEGKGARLENPRLRAF